MSTRPRSPTTFSILVFKLHIITTHYHNTYTSHPMSYSLCLKPTWRTRALETSLITRRQRRKQQINISQPVYKGYHGFCAPCVVTPVLFVCCLFIVWKWPGTTSVFHRYEISFDVTALLNIIIWRHIFFTHKESKTPRAAWLRREGVTTRDFFPTWQSLIYFSWRRPSLWKVHRRKCLDE